MILGVLLTSTLGQYALYHLNTFLEIHYFQKGGGCLWIWNINGIQNTFIVCRLS